MVSGTIGWSNVTLRNGATLDLALRLEPDHVERSTAGGWVGLAVGRCGWERGLDRLGDQRWWQGLRWSFELGAIGVGNVPRWQPLEDRLDVGGGDRGAVDDHRRLGDLVLRVPFAQSEAELGGIVDDLRRPLPRSRSDRRPNRSATDGAVVSDGGSESSSSPPNQHADRAIGQHDDGRRPSSHRPACHPRTVPLAHQPYELDGDFDVACRRVVPRDRVESRRVVRCQTPHTIGVHLRMSTDRRRSIVAPVTSNRIR